MNKTIKTKVTIFVGLIIFSIVILQVIFNIFLANPYFKAQKSNVIEQLFSQIKQNYSDDEPKLYKIINHREETDNLQITILDELTNVIYSSYGKNNPFPANAPFRFKNEKGRVIFSENPSAVLQVNYRTNEKSLMLHGIINSENGKRFIVIETPISGVEQSAKILAKFSVFISIFALLFGGFAAYIFASKFSKPIKQIDEVARNVAVLNFTKKADENLPDDEIGRLAKNINIMSDTLSQMISKLTSANQVLQKGIDYQKQIEKMRREFIANVSHELKTPLSLLLGYSEMLKNDVEGIDKSFYYDVIIDESQKMDQLVRSLLDISSIENNLVKLKKENIKLGEVASLLTAKNYVLFAKKGIIYNTHFENDCCVSGDKIHLEQVMKNYMINAISHTKPNNMVKISVKKQQENVVFSIYNEGENIPMENIDKIWDSFYRTDQARTRNDENNVGLGLYIVKTIINAHEGNYGVINHDGGVEFWFSLKITN
ncbi:HAMP domain-containing histidine kinase [Clostridium estertheticum]|uniref:sensor histidine kinase n=1 Tax=Clostridium estertheticum TaxID=238834 RepID=UPI0013EE7C1C|nr:HAMP domain-containing sensor histidine kinase [Clostridium estertheticum]MBZ9606295.1 HAMP domain-containing histidine kinase [Clostridium estertheticum]